MATLNVYEQANVACSASPRSWLYVVLLFFSLFLTFNGSVSIPLSRIPGLDKERNSLKYPVPIPEPKDISPSCTTLWPTFRTLACLIVHYIILYRVVQLFILYYRIFYQSCFLAATNVGPTSCVANGARLYRLAHYFVLFWGLGLLLGCLATSGAKSDVRFCSATPISYKGDEISRLSRLVFEI